VVIVGILFAGIRIGAQLGLQFSFGIPRELGGSIIALIFLFVAAGKFYRDNIENVSAYVDRLRGRKTAVEAAVEEQS
jgi:simple sugar transport system permease protein